MLLLLFLFLVTVVRADNCTECISYGNTWCVESSACHFITLGCNTIINDAVNCPMTPRAGYEYDDAFGRFVALPHMAASYVDDPTECLRNYLPSTKLYKRVTVNCQGPNTTCYAYTAYDPVNKSIAVVFRGTQGAVQLDEEVLSLFQHKAPFFDHGHLWKYFYDAFNFLWNGGLEDAVKSLKAQHPDYQLWAFGHSLGGAISTIFASYIIKTGLYSPENVRLLTFAQPRTGDREFAKWHDSVFLYSYRVVHHRDPGPHIPFLFNGVWHHRYEVWYNNNMTLGMPYHICEKGDGFYCSNRQLDLAKDDHVVYFNERLGDWAKEGCPKRNNSPPSRTKKVCDSGH